MDGVTLVRPGLLSDFDKADNRLMYNQNGKCSHLFEEPACNAFDPGFLKHF